MKIIFLTNMPSYHQSELADSLAAEVGVDNFRLVFYQDTSADRREMGWADQYNAPYIIRFWESPESVRETQDWIKNADIAIKGRFPTRYIRDRLREGKLTFSCQERCWKKPLNMARLLFRIPHLLRNYFSIYANNFHFLAIGHSASRDLNCLGLFRSRSWKFGYFINSPIEPATVKITEPRANSLSILWCGRFSAVKQPLDAIEIIKRLREQGRQCHLTMIGDGALRSEIQSAITQFDLKSHISLTGWQTPDQVKCLMQDSDLFLMTSSRAEGWGVVINEAINVACPVAANQELGAAPWLIRDGQTGFLFERDKLDDLVQRLCAITPQQLAQMGAAGQQYVAQKWSTEAAATRLLTLSKALLAQQGAVGDRGAKKIIAQELYSDGPCAADI